MSHFSLLNHIGCSIGIHMRKPTDLLKIRTRIPTEIIALPDELTIVYKTFEFRIHATECACGKQRYNIERVMRSPGGTLIVKREDATAAKEFMDFFEEKQIPIRELELKELMGMAFNHDYQPIPLSQLSRYGNALDGKSTTARTEFDTAMFSYSFMNEAITMWCSKPDACFGIGEISL